MVDEGQFRRPTHRIYAVVRQDDQLSDVWINVGLSFAHEDGKGFEIELKALPIDGRLICRDVTADDERHRRGLIFSSGA